ncbi:hypothetical protein ACFXEZ_08425, partial [Streptomyces hygroscopicus]
MGRYDLALIGFGGVNRALAELISQRGDRLAEELGFALRVVAITDLRAGSLVDTHGIDLAPLLAAEPGELACAGLPGGSAGLAGRGPGRLPRLQPAPRAAVAPRDGRGAAGSCRGRLTQKGPPAAAARGGAPRGAGAGGPGARAGSVVGAVAGAG